LGTPEAAWFTWALDVLVAIQFPLCDLRSFAVEHTGKLAVPPWPVVEPEREFVRGFGAVRRRRRGGVDPWVGEEHYCDAARALRFPGRFHPGPSSEGARRVAAACAFRRLLCAAGPSARVEVGLSLRPIGKRSRPLPLGPSTLLSWVSALPVTVAPHGGTVHALVTAGGPLADALLHATTRTALARPDNPWIIAGEPLLFIEAEHGELDAMPSGARAVAGLERHRLALYHARTRSCGRTLRSWTLVGARNGDRDVARRLRMHLLRMHAERESLRAVLRALALGRITIAPREPAADALQRYLQESMRLLERKRPLGLPGAELLAAAQDYDELVEQGLRTSLLGQLEHARRSVAERVRRATMGRAREPATVYFISTRELTMHQYSINFGDHNVVHGDVVVAEQIQSSFNKAAAGEDNGQLRAYLKQLAVEVAELTKALPEEQARECARDLEVLTTEALAPSPRKKWYELAAAGLLDAAHTVGEIAGKLIKIVTSVLAILGS
jgi:hypothetical protein